MSSAMSTAMMSAPSSASRTAWLLPWPRAAPVMKATLPETRPLICPAPRRPCRLVRLLEGVAGVDRQRYARDVASLVRGQEQQRVADVLRLHPRDRHRVRRLERGGRVLGRRVLQVRAEQPEG